MSRLSVVTVVGMAVLMGAVSANALTITVGAGKDFATIQGAVNHAATFDDNAGAANNVPSADPIDIVIDGGTYVENVNLPADSSSKFNGKNDGWTIRNAPGQRVIVQGGINVANDRDHLLFNGINVNMVGRSGYTFAQTARSTTVQNAFIYGGNDTAVNFAALSQNRLFGTNFYKHLTIWNNTFGLVSSGNSTAVSADIILAGSGTYGSGQFGGNFLDYSFSNLFNTQNCNSGDLGGLGDCTEAYRDQGNNILYPFGLDPEFFSTDPNNSRFLWLKDTSPSAGTGSSAGDFTNGQSNMGALPAVPEPATLGLLLGGLCLLARRRR